MFREKIPRRQLSAWQFAAMTPVLIQLLGGASWFWIILMGGISLLVQWILRKWGVEAESRWLFVLQLLYIIVLLGSITGYASQSWPRSNSYPWVPLILLALAAWSAQKGTSAAARVGCVLFWGVLIVYLLVFGAGIREMEHNWFVFTKKAPEWLGAVIFITPVVAAILGNEGKAGGKSLLPVIFCLLAAVITNAVLSPAVASGMDNAFYEMSRSLSLFGVAKRFEALISAAMTVGWFTLLNLYLSVAGRLSEKIFPEWGRPGVWTTAVVSAGCMLCGLRVSAVNLLIFAAVIWVALPILLQLLKQIKKSEKNEKSA